jgi:RNA 2',3'-cyclic 3'-phosphodiesterase
MKRLFIALHIHPTEEFLDAIDIIKDQLSTERVKWVEEENLHLTLKFIGEVDEVMVENIKQHLKRKRSNGTIEFSIEGIGLIRNLSDPRAIYATIKNTNRIENLYREIDSLLTEIGICSETKSFLPHLTLGRLKTVHDKELLKDILTDFNNNYFQKEVCKEFILFESILTPKGPIYKKLSVYPV